jgi:hypothetical protein
MIYAGAALLAYSKQITGGGPSDPKLREQLIEAGWQPYSVKVGDRYVSYRRADPILTPLSIVADLVEMSGEMGDGDITQVSAAALSAIASSVTSKTFMQGVSDALAAFSGRNPRGMESFIQRTAGSFVPAAVSRGNPDAVMREARSFVDAMKARIPGFSETLEPRRNLFGEVMLKAPGYANAALNPFTISGKVELPGNVLNELTKLGVAMPMPPERKDGMDLTDRETFNDRKAPNGQPQSPYDRWLELIGETDLKAQLRQQIESPEWSTYSDEIKLTIAGALVQGYQAQAYGQMLREYPSVLQGLQQGAELEAAHMAGTDPADIIRRYEKLFVRVKPRSSPAMQ